VGQLDDLLARRVGQGAAVDVDPSELVDAAVTCTQICTKASSQRGLCAPVSLCSLLHCLLSVSAENCVCGQGESEVPLGSFSAELYVPCGDYLLSHAKRASEHRRRRRRHPRHT
jgi:hypothetical protein